MRRYVDPDRNEHASFDAIEHIKRGPSFGVISDSARRLGPPGRRPPLVWTHDQRVTWFNG